MAFLAGIAALAGPILARVLLALGLSAVTLLGVTTVVTQMRGTLMGYIGAAPSAGLQLAGLAGVWVGLGMWLGAITFTISLWGMTKAVRIVGGGS